MTDSILREEYGPPEKLWIDERSDYIAIKTVDRSLHLIDKAKVLWTREEGLTMVKEWVIGKNEDILPVDEFSMNPLQSLIQRMNDQTSSLITNVKYTVENIKKIINKEDLPKKHVKSSLDYLFVLLSFIIGAYKEFKDICTQSYRWTYYLAKNCTKFH